MVVNFHEGYDGHGYVTILAMAVLAIAMLVMAVMAMALAVMPKAAMSIVVHMIMMVMTMWARIPWTTWGMFCTSNGHILETQCISYGNWLKGQ